MATSRLCSIPDCGKRHFGHGWCSMHYERWRKHGDPLGGRIPNGEALQHYRDVVLSYDGDECLTWPFNRPLGYGKIHFNGRKQTVSRMVCEHVNGAPPTPHHDAAHICGNGHLGCVTKKHLVWKTRAGNMADAIEHGTTNRGVKNPNAKLTEDDIHLVRAMRKKLPPSEIAGLFGVSPRAVRDVLNGKTWAWL